MRTDLTLPVICIMWSLAFPLSAAAQSTPPDRSADAAAIRAHIESICQAFVDKDRKKLEGTHGKDWRGFTPWSGHVIRGLDGYMNEATFEPGTPKGQGMVGYRLSDFDAVFYGDTAVASFVLDLDIVYGAEKSTQKLTLIERWISLREGNQQPNAASRPKCSRGDSARGSIQAGSWQEQASEGCSGTLALMYLYLTTTGRRSGLPREIEIWFTEREGRFYVIAEHRERAQWVRNILADSHVRVRVGDRGFAGIARPVSDEREPELARTVKELSDAKYGWSDGLLVEIAAD